MSTTTQLPGSSIVNAAIQVVLEDLRAHPEGIRNVDLAETTGLDLPVTAQRHYITYTILMYLVEQGTVQKRGHLYRLA
jgi:hypothetical protein